MGESMMAEIAVCGLDCGACDIRQAPFDPAAAERIVAWFRERKWLSEEDGIDAVLERSMYCRGCHGDRTVHWSPECPILTCCVDEQGLEFCSQCETFPCERLTERAQGNERYARALQRLQQMS